MMRTWATVSFRRVRSFCYLFFLTESDKLKNENKTKTLYRHIIYQNFQKKIFYKLNIFLALNKIHTNLDNSKSAIGAIKTQ